MEAPEVPERYFDALDLYWQLRTGESLSYAELLAYTQLTGEVIEPWLAEQLVMIDRIVQGLIVRRGYGKEDADRGVPNAGGHTD